MARFLGTFVVLVVIGYMAMVAFLPTPNVAGNGERDGGRAAAARLAGEAAILVAPSDHGAGDRHRRAADRAS